MKVSLRLFPALLALWWGAAAHALTTITPATHEVGAGTVPYQILVTSDGDWAASTTANWVTLSRTVGSLEGNILVTAAANTTGADRSAPIVVDGVTHTLTQRSAGTALQELWAWGSDDSGQLGDNALLRSFCLTPEEILASGVQSAAAVRGLSLIVKTDGSLWAMGKDLSGRLNIGNKTDPSNPVRVLENGVRSVVVGQNSSLLIVKTDGSLWAMGWNSTGQLGDGTTIDRPSLVQILTGGVQSVATTMSGESPPTSSREDGSHSLIVKTDGSLWAMGDNRFGQLGDGSTITRLSPVQILAGGVQSVAAGRGHSLIVKTDGSLWAVGRNWYGQLGDGTTIGQTTPIQVLASGVRSVAAGNEYSLVVKLDGSLLAVGGNDTGQLGDGTTTSRPSLVPILANGVQSVVTTGVYTREGMHGYYLSAYTLVVKTDSSLWAMGSNSFGQLGDGTTTNRLSPVQILAGGVQSVAATFNHSLIVMAGGSVWGAGSNGFGQLGYSSALSIDTPLQILAGEFRSLTAGGAHSLVVKADGSLWTVGGNTYGQLGDGTTINRTSPVPILPGGVHSAAAGTAHSLVVHANGSLWAMGRNDQGQLGDGTTTNRTSPVQILGGGVRAASAGGQHSLIVKMDGSLWATGLNNFGQLGDGTATSRMSPVQILAGGVQSVSAGRYHSLIVKTDGSLLAMGLNMVGPYWASTEDHWLSPRQVLASGVQLVAAGGSHSLIVKTDGSMWGLGYELAFADMYNSLGNPVPIFANGVQSVAAGGRHSLILKTDGSLWAMGDNSSGQLGDGTTTDRTSPVLVARNVRRVAAGGEHSLIVASGEIVPDVPVIRTQPESKAAVAGDAVALTVEAPRSPNIQWFRDGRALEGGTGATLTLSAITPSDAGIYDAVLSAGTATTLSRPVVVGVLPAAGERTAGSITTRAEWQDIHHPNGAVCDQFLLTGAAGTFTADPNQIARCSFIDNNGSIVQVEMSGAGAITIALDGATGPLAPALYNQTGIEYMKGKATIILAGANQSTHFTIYSVGTANNPGVTRPDMAYNGWADVAVAGILSADGLLGGLHHGNVTYSATMGYTGIYAPYVFGINSLAVVHGIEASGSAQPYLYFDFMLIPWSGGVNVKIAGSSLGQPNGGSITVGGLAEVQMGAGQDSCGRAAPAQAIGTLLLDETGIDCTAALVVVP